MEDIIEATGRGIWAVIRFIVWHVVVQIVLFNTGRAVLLVLSFGRFPRAHHVERYSELVAGVGGGVLLLAWAAVVIVNRTQGAGV